MNLRQKQKQFEALKNSGALDARAADPALDADLAVTKKFTEAVAESFTKYEYRRTPEIILGGLELLALGNAHRNAHYRHRKDTHRNCTSAQFNKVAKSLGFEQVGRFPMHRKNGPREHTFVMARPDGLMLTWNTYRKSANAARLTFQSKASGYPEGASGGFKDAPRGARFFFGSNSVLEGLRETVDRLSQTGQLLKVWHKTNDFDTRHLYTLESDYSHQAERTPAAEKDFGLKCKLVEEVNNKRAATMPLWVQQMTGVAPLRAPKPV